MTRHPRLPTIVVMTAAALLGVGLLTATGQFRRPTASTATLEQLESQLVSRGNASVDPALWCAYGDKLRGAGRFGAAARAYERALELQPDNAAARLYAGVALAQSDNADAFFGYLNRLTATSPKLALDLLARPELAPLHADSRWSPAMIAAQAQAAD